MTAHELIASPFLGSYLVVRPGRRNAIKISRARYAQLEATGPGDPSPGWLTGTTGLGHRHQRPGAA
ncbi:MAG: hypothetical protein JWM19_84 [Actinomycetia bacterium]|nr:hypothetical protein [Actinomycetes bacterium]